MKTFALCFTGLSGSGKTTLLNELNRILHKRGIPVQTMDGDQLRQELGQLFGYTQEERMKQGRVVRLLSRYLNQNGVSTIVAGVEAYQEGRLLMRRELGECYIQVYLDCPIEECIRRDVKGYYKDISKLKNFHGIDAPYEIPTDSEIVVDTVHLSVEESVQKILDYLESNHYFATEEIPMEWTIKRNILLNPGPATTTDTVKMAQIVPDICPREKEFVETMRQLRQDLLKTVHANPEEYTSVLFCGSGTLNMDVCLNSLLPAEKKVLVVNNGAYSARAVEICAAYGLPHIDLRFPVDQRPDLALVEQTLQAHPDIALIYTTHHETGTGILNPIREIGALAHQYSAVFVVDMTSTLAMLPIELAAENVDFCMASAQKGLMAMTGLSFVIGRRSILEASKHYPRRSYYCNLYLQYAGFEQTGEMRFTPPVQTIYAAVQGLKEYFAEGETAKWARHTRVFQAIHRGLEELGFQDVIRREWQSGLVVSVRYPDDENWNFETIHDYCYARGFTIYPGKITGTNTFRLCALGAIDEKDICDFFHVLREALEANQINIPVRYQNLDVSK